MSRARSPLAYLASVALLATSALLGACDGDDSEDDATTMEPSTATPTAPTGDDSGGAADGRCAPDNAALMCAETDCAFEVAEVDCAAACANIATLCANNECDAQCNGLESDPTLCGAACEGTKGLSCSNVVFGCYTSNMGCDDVGSCVDANK